MIPRSEWLENPYTRELKKRVRRVVQEIKDEWALGHFMTSEDEAYARGRIAGLKEIFELEEE